MTWNPSAPDLILLNGHIRTMDAQRPRAQAMAVKAGRIMAVGDNDEISALADSKSERVNLDGRLGIPGMMDSRPTAARSGACQIFR
jgi:predicted amidohydrolase YtcJ